MIADILLSWAIVIAIAAVVVSVQFIVRGIPQRRVEVLVKRLSFGRSQQPGEAAEGWGYRLQSFGDIAWAFADAMNRGSASQACPALVKARCKPKRNLHRPGDVTKVRAGLEQASAPASSQGH